MISRKIYKIIVLGIIAVFVFGSSPYSYAAKSKKSSKAGHSAAAKAGKKSSVKKKSSASKKKSSSKKRTSAASKSKKKGSRSRVSKRGRRSSVLSVQKETVRKESVRKDSNYVNPDDLPAVDDDQEDLPVETETIKVSDLLEKYVVSNQYNTPSDSINHKEKMIMEIIKYLDTPYKFGGNTSRGIDCSAFTRTILGNTFSLELPRTAREQYHLGLEVNNKTELKFGDLVFFNTRRRVRPGHVGIYIGDNLFAHSSSKQGVMVSSLQTDFYSKRFMGGRRMDAVLTH